MKPEIALTGVTGTLGKEIGRVMHERNIAFKPLARSLTPSFDYEKRESHQEALAGIKQLVLIAYQSTPGLIAFLEYAKSVEHIVVISGMSANVRHDSHLATIEKSVEASGIFHTTLRLNWFMQNFVTFFREDIVKRGVIEVPAGESKTSFVDIRDVAEAVVNLLVEKEGRGKVYSLTGPDSLSWGDVAKELSRVSGRQIVYRPLSEEEGRKKFVALGWNDPETTALFREMREGSTAPVDNSLERLLGHPSRSLATFAKEFCASWKS